MKILFFFFGLVIFIWIINQENPASENENTSPKDGVLIFFGEEPLLDSIPPFEKREILIH